MEHCIVYFSNWVGPFQEESFSRLLQQSRQNNALKGITGMLLYVRGNVIQVLEGEQQAVEALYERIEQDPRHTNISRVLDRPIRERLFAQWSMGYETLTNQQLDEINILIDLDERAEKVGSQETPIILKTLKVFYESNRYN